MSKAQDSNVVTVRSLVVYLLVLSTVLFVDVKTSFLSSSRATLSYLTYPIASVASVPGRLFNQVDDLLVSQPDINYAYQHLHSEYFKVKVQMLEAEAIKKENQRLRSFFGMVDRSALSMLLANPLKIDLDPYQHRILIDKGIKDGVYMGQAAFDDKGVIGQVTDIFSVSSVVTLITDPAHSIPVQVRRNGLHTLAEGIGAFNSMRVPFLNKNVDLQEGDILETSGLGGRFAKGYSVAVVESIQSGEETFLQVKAIPSAAIDSLQFVLLVSKDKKEKLHKAMVENER